MNKKIISLISSVITLSLLAGCTSTSSRQVSQNTTQNQTDNSKSSSNNNQATENTTQNQIDNSDPSCITQVTQNTTQNQIDSSKSPSNNQLSKAFEDELTGFTTIEQDIKKGDFNDASKVADKLGETFHKSIYQPLKDKNGASFADDVHSKLHELHDVVKNKDTAKISDLIKVNRDNLNAIANILGVSINK